MQRKRHINFKDKELNYSSSGRLSSILHSIPTLLLHNRSSDKQMKNSLKSNVLYSIPCGCVLALLLAVCASVLYNSEAYADWVVGCVGTAGPDLDSSSVVPIPGGTTTPPTASLSLSNPNMTSSAINPGNTTTVSTNVTVNVGNAESYSLTLKVDSTTLKNGNTTINAGNVESDNTWGYKWDNATSYTAPSTTAKILTVPALSNGSTSFTKNLTFGAKFGANAEAGHYKGSGTLSLVATPKATTYTLADLTQMQQLSLAPEACANTPYLSGQTYSAEYTLTDVRDNNTYTIRKFGDGKCWMTKNLKLSARTIGCILDRKLSPNTSDVLEEWIMPTSKISGFNDNTSQDSYYDTNTDTGYYSWCAATAGTCSSATSSGANATSSICPKGWKLPTGMVTGANTSNDFYNLFSKMNLGVTVGTSGGTSWGSSQGLAISQGSPYNFAYTGYVYDGSLGNTTTEGAWWSRTAYSSTRAYSLYVLSSIVYPGTNNNSRYGGFAVRCVAE